MRKWLGRKEELKNLLIKMLEVGFLERQVDLTGKLVDKEAEDEPSVSVWKSALQKAVRRCEVEKAMYAALQLLEKAGWYVTWRRLRIIAVEDCGMPEIITAVETLYRLFLEYKGKKDKAELSWDAKRCVICAAKIMAEAPKDRRADEFLELIDAVEKYGDKIPNLRLLLENWMPSDEAYDMHTKEGRKMGRGLLYWYQVSSKCENMTDEYRKWREWFEPFMIELIKRKKEKEEK